MHNAVMGTTIFLVVFSVICLMAFSMSGTRDKVQLAIARSFDELHFVSEHSKDGYRGRDLFVLKRAEPFLFSAYDERNFFGRDPSVNDIHWYCKSAEGHYFLAIGLIANRYGKYEVEWVVRSLTEARMRGALQAYPDVYWAEFGERTKT